MQSTLWAIRLGHASKSDGKPIVFWCDNGIGIDPKFHDQVFDLFNKLDAQTEGTGVGLVLVKRIVEVHGGQRRDVLVYSSA